MIFLSLPLTTSFKKGQDLIPVGVRKAKARRVIGRRIHDDNRVVLLSNHIADMFFEAFEIEFSVIGQQVKFPQLTAIIVTHRTVSTPVPITGQDVVTPFRIVVNDVMENAGAARGGAARI